MKLPAMPAGPPLARRDFVIAGVVTVLCVVLFGVIDDPGEPAAGSLERTLGAAAFVLITAPVLWRRRAPVQAAAGFLVAVGLHVAAFGTVTRCGLVLPVSFVLGFAAAANLPQREALLALGGIVAAQAVMLLDDGSAGLDAMVIAVPAALAVWAGGRIVRSRTALTEALTEHNAEVRATREENARLEVATDRVRLSAELDELLRRRLGELARLAEAGGGDDAIGALQRIESESRATLDQMRATVSLLRGDEDHITEPQPTLTHLDALVLRAKGDGASVVLTGSPRALPAGLELSAYRVVEHLLAATDEGPGVEVEVNFGSDALEVTVAGPARRRGEAAIERARERVALHHGTLAASSRGGRTHVTAAFPVLAAV